MTVTEKIMDLSQAWRYAGEVFPYFDRVDIDWDAAYQEFLPRAMETKTDREHALLMAEFLARLGDGHTDFALKKTLLDEAGYLPFHLDYHGERYYVDGAQVLGFNGKPMDQVLEELYRYSYHVGKFVPHYRIRTLLPAFLKKTGNTMETADGVREFDLLEIPIPARQQGPAFVTKGFGAVLYLKLADFMHSGWDQAIRTELNGKSGVILDLRENMGGMTKYAADIAQLFLNGEFHACQRWTRTMKGYDLASASQMHPFTKEVTDGYVKNRLCTQGDVDRWERLWDRRQCEVYVDRFGTPGQKAVFDGQVVLLTGRDTVSAAEDFVAMFRSNRRALIVGEPTQGTSGTTLWVHLAGGSLRICTVGYRLLDGTEFIGTGIRPDVEIAPTPEQVRLGLDPVLEYALDYLKDA